MALAAMAIALAAALASGAHGTAILLFGAITAGLAAAALRYTATPIQRIAIAAFELAAASYTLSAWNLSQVAQDVVNLGTLKPALLYPFVTGLRYIPVYVVVLFYWAALAVRQDTGFAADIFHRRTYWGLACAFTMLTIVAVATGYGDGAIWTSGLPDRAIIMSCHVIVFILNTTLAVVAFRHFNRHRISSHAPLFASCVVVFVGIAATAVIMEHRYEVVNRGHIDVRRPVGYVASNPDAIVEYRRNLAAGVPSDAGPDFVRLVNDAEFERALREDRFYRRSFDEPFQITGGAVIYGYRPRIATTLAEPRFVFVRLPPALARALQFRAVRE